MSELSKGKKVHRNASVFFSTSMLYLKCNDSLSPFFLDYKKSKIHTKPCSKNTSSQIYQKATCSQRKIKSVSNKKRRKRKWEARFSASKAHKSNLFHTHSSMYS